MLSTHAWCVVTCEEQAGKPFSSLEPVQSGGRRTESRRHGKALPCDFPCMPSTVHPDSFLTSGKWKVTRIRFCDGRSDMETSVHRRPLFRPLLNAAKDRFHQHLFHNDQKEAACLNKLRQKKNITAKSWQEAQEKAGKNVSVTKVGGRKRG